MLLIKVNKTDHYSFRHFSKFVQKTNYISYKRYEMNKISYKRYEINKFYTIFTEILFKLNPTIISIMIELTL